MNEEQKKEGFRCGMVSIIGRPNVGKSTLLNKIIGEKVAIVSNVPQTTRSQVRGIYTDERGQIIFTDTPGVLPGKDRLDKWLARASRDAVPQADCIIHLVDSSEPTGREEDEVMRRLQNVNVPVILGLNKIDLKGKFLPQYIALWEKIKGKPVQELPSLVLLPLSGKTGKNVDQLLDEIFKFLPEGPALYPEDIISDVPQKMVISDVIREKLLGVLRDELPHSIAVVIEKMDRRRNNVTYIGALILVERESQKEIVIGRGGSVLKAIGTSARRELEELLERKVFLDIHVKLDANWRQDGEVLHDLGYEG